MSQLPLVLAGPILRRVLPNRLCLWLVCSEKNEVELHLLLGAKVITLDHADLAKTAQFIPLATHSTLYLLEINLPEALPLDTWIEYDLALKHQGKWQSILAWGPELGYTLGSRPRFVIHSKLRQVAHGSCRKPHHASRDGLTRLDDTLSKENIDAKAVPSTLILSGDQVYCDDVAGPMLRAIHQLIATLDFPAEALDARNVKSSKALHSSAANYYQRQKLLPKTQSRQSIYDVLIGGANKPIFTSVNAKNHLISLAETLCMYLLVWSPIPWQLIDRTAPQELKGKRLKRYEKENLLIEQFIDELPAVRRVLAHIPTAMIFDDHDITDDWNLTAAWEKTAYNNTLSRRIIGNALIAYLLCQAWGNAPENFPPEFWQQADEVLLKPGSSEHDGFIKQCLDFDHWHFHWPTEPPIIALDTRTHRWHRDASPFLPSGLMNAEKLSALKQELEGKKQAIIVSAAPMFGVKLIEVIQRIFTWLGKPLLVDAENWMAHPGAAEALLDIFEHARTPQKFIILSGDVHYSFAYFIRIRSKRSSPKIWQITSSGIKNEFPRLLLEIFDRMNRWLYAPRSPLNWLTRRRKLRITPYIPRPASTGERLLNSSGIGIIYFNEQSKLENIIEHSGDGLDIVFHEDKQGRRWE